MAKIIGNTTATPVPRSDWNQVDPNKADFILNKPDVALSTHTHSDYETKADATSKLTEAKEYVDSVSSTLEAAQAANAAAIALKASTEDLTKVSDRVAELETWSSNFTEISEQEINALFA